MSERGTRGSNEYVASTARMGGVGVADRQPRDVECGRPTLTSEGTLSSLHGGPRDAQRRPDRGRLHCSERHLLGGLRVVNSPFQG